MELHLALPCIMALLQLSTATAALLPPPLMAAPPMASVRVLLLLHLARGHQARWALSVALFGKWQR